MSKRTTSDKGIKSIAIREGNILKGYKDSKGLLTIGVGHLVKAGEPYKLHEPITAAESMRLLKIDLAEAEEAVNLSVKVPLTQNQFDACVSFAFNIGTKGFKNSTVVKRLNQKDYAGAAKAFMNWVKPPELRGRRESEVSQFLKPDSAPSRTTPAIDPKRASKDAVPLTEAAPETPNVNIENADKVNIEKQDLPPTGEQIVTKERANPFLKIVAVFTTITGLGINLGELVTTRIEAMTGKQLGYMAAILGLVAIAIYAFHKSSERADSRTKLLVNIAADPSKNNVSIEEPK